MFKIQTMNKIAAAGIEALEKNGCQVGENIKYPTGLLLRSADLHEMEFPESLLAIARAGAGYNNIPVDRCTEEGIVVFNAPGANAQAVKEQEICSLVMASRDILGSIAGYNPSPEREKKSPNWSRRKNLLLPDRNCWARRWASSAWARWAPWWQTWAWT